MTLKKHQAKIDAARYIKEGDILAAATPPPLPITLQTFLHSLVDVNPRPPPEPETVRGLAGH